MKRLSWPQYRLRTLFAIATCVAVAIALASVHLSRARKQRVAVEQLRAAGAIVKYDSALLDDLPPLPYGIGLGQLSERSNDEGSLGWLASTFGVDAIHKVVSVDLSNAQPVQEMRQVRRLHWLQSLSLGQYNGQSGIDDESWALVLRCNQIETLNLRRGSSGPRPLTGLSQLSGLHRLTIENGHLTRADVQQIGSLKQLRQLELKSVVTSDQALKPLSGLAELYTLDIICGGKPETITDDGISFIAAMPNLVSLTLDQVTRITDATLENIGRLKHLRKLNLSGSSVKGKGISQLKHLSRLHQLNLSGTKLNDDVIDELSTLSQLSYLDVSLTDLTDESVQHLVKLRNLHHLNLSCQNIGDRSIQQIADLPRLQALLLRGSKVSDAGLEHMVPMSSLKSLNVDETDVSVQGIHAFRQLRPDVQTW